MAPKLNQNPERKQKLTKTAKIIIAGGTSLLIILIAVLIGVTLMSNPNQADAVNATFTSTNDGDWNNSSTWNSTGTSRSIPDSNDNVVISNKVTVKKVGNLADTIVVKGATLAVNNGGEINFDQLKLEYTSQRINSKYGWVTTYTASTVDVKNGELSLSDDVLLSSNSNTSKKHNVTIKNNGTFKLAGDFVNTGSGSLTANAGSLLVLNGNVQQTMPGDNFASVNELKINNSATTSPQVKLNGDLTIKDSLILQNGVIKSSATECIKMGASSGMRGWSESNSFIKGSYSNKGKPGDSLLFRLMGNSNTHKIAVHGLSNSNTFQVNYHGKNPTNQFNNQMASGSGLNFVSNDEYWNIDKTSNNSTNCKVTLFWDNNTPTQVGNISQDTNLVVAHFNQSSQEWENVGHSKLNGGVNSSGAVTSNGVNSFSPFTFGSKSSNSPLPVELIAFKVEQTKDKAKLTWKTASETNNSHFKVQKSQNGEDFKNIGKVEGAGTVTREQNYRFTDNDPVNGTSYYRLKQVDHDGSYEYSVVKALKWSNKEEIAGDWKVKVNDINPNPFKQRFDANYQLKHAGPIQIAIRNMKGKIIHQESINGKKGENTYTFNKGEQISRGTYIVVFNSQGNRTTQKIIKQ